MTRTEIIVEALGIKIAMRRGPRGWALCPYHDDKAPRSFFIRLKGDRAGQNHCFSCKNGGGLTTLVKQVRGCDDEAAKAFIALLGKGYEPPKVHAYVVARPPKLGRLRFKMPSSVIFEPLAEWVSLAKRYAISRGITEEEVSLYRLGYAVDGRLGGRMIIPWLGAGGVAAGYSARTFCDQEPKYQTPDMDDNADRTVMFGEHLWPPPGARPVVVVTEGALNGMAVRRAIDGAPVAALGGSEIDPLHAVKLATFSRVVLLTDPDAAGDMAAASLGSMLGRHAEVIRVKLPPRKDALDVLLERGARGLRAFLTPVTFAMP